MNRSQLLKIFLILTAFLGGQLSFSFGFDLSIHQLTDHDSPHHHEHGSGHDDETPVSQQNDGHDATSHDHSDELRFFSQTSYLMPSAGYIADKLNVSNLKLSLHASRPITYDHDFRIHRPPCVS